MGAQHDTGNIRAGNIGNAEVFFSDIGHCKAECKADNRDALGVRIAGIEPLHNRMEYKADADSNEEEKRRLDQHTADAGPSPELAPSTQVSTTIPMTSSITAALTMVVPRKLFRCPNSCSVATVMETLVAVMIVPMNSAR